MSLVVRNVPFAGKDNRAFDTAIAVPRDEGPLLFGANAIAASSQTHDLVVNWKLHLGKTEFQVKKLMLENPTMERVLRKYSLLDIATYYFDNVTSMIKKLTPLESDPQFIVGIPASSQTESARARERYIKIVEGAFSKIGLPRPRFFPEPFAVFQYHWNNGDLVDSGKPQSVFVLDIGGGTTNVCLIRTSVHGRLARGGGNHLPHAVRTADIGGGQIDQLLLDRVVKSTRIREAERALNDVRLWKERLSKQLNEAGMWTDDEYARNLSGTVSVEGQGDWRLTGADLSSVIRLRFWPTIRDLIGEALEEIRTLSQEGGWGVIDKVILAGGTCQADIVRVLFQESFGSDPIFLGVDYIKSPNYHEAVSSGLVIEARANSRLHDIRPARVAPFIQSDIHLLASHRKDRVQVPSRLRTDDSVEGVCAETNGAILRAPVSLSKMLGKKIQWSFRLEQKPREIWYRLEKDRDSYNKTSDCDDHASNFVRVCRRTKPQPSNKVTLNMALRDDGFCDISFDVRHADLGEVSYQGQPIDLHDLNGLGCEAFFGLDFGTTSTLCSYVNLTEHPATGSLPESYRVNDLIRTRCLELEGRARGILAQSKSPAKTLLEFNKFIVKEYVYHSNRIEGSLLSRGATKRVLEAIEEGRETSAISLVSFLSQRFSYVDDNGDIKSASRPINDHVAAVNLRDAFAYIEELSADKDYGLSPSILKSLHQLVMRGDKNIVAGVFRTNSVRISQTSFVPPDAIHVSHLIHDMFEYLNGESFGQLSAIEQAAIAHAKFVSIHPFDDGNGRIARLLANFYLWKAGLPGLLLVWENRDRYYDALEECNSNEIAKRGDLSDLCSLFCDLFEDGVEFLAGHVGEDLSKIDDGDSEAEEEPVISGSKIVSPLLAQILGRISEKKLAMNPDEQYRVWQNSYERLLSSLKSDIDTASRAFSDGWSGGIQVLEYPIIDIDTFSAIRRRGHFSRTWYIRARFTLPKEICELVFYFASCSKYARNLNESFGNSPTLHLSWLYAEAGKYVDVGREKWCRVKEFVHDGSRMSVVLNDDEAGEVRYVSEDSAVFNDWFAMVLQDMLKNFSGVEI